MDRTTVARLRPTSSRRRRPGRASPRHPGGRVSALPRRRRPEAIGPATTGTRSPRPSGRAGVPAVYGFDIETDTRVDGLDPGRSRVIMAAVATAERTEVFAETDEAELLDRLDWYLASLEPGVLATWNGSAFDLPFVADRARYHGVALGLTLRVDPAIARRHPPLAGHAGAYRASWHSHAHLDGYQVFRADVSPALGVSSSLKSVARLCGLGPIELDAAQLHTSAPTDVRAYVSSDARCARELVRRRWPTARLAVDDPPARLSLPGPVPVPDHAGP